MEEKPKKHFLYHRVPSDMRVNEEGKKILYPLNVLKEKFPDLYEVEAGKYLEPHGENEEERKSIPKRLIPTLENAVWGDVLNLTAIHPQDLMDTLQSFGFSPKEMKFYQVDPDLLDRDHATVYLYNNNEEIGDDDLKQYIKFDPVNVSEYAFITEKTKSHYQSSFDEKIKPLLFVGIPHVLYKKHLDVSDVEQFPVITAVPKQYDSNL